MSKVDASDDKSIRLEVVFSRVEHQTCAVSGYPIKGSVVVHCPSETSHSGITLTISGAVVLRDSSSSAGFDSVKAEPVTFYNVVVPIAAAGKLPPGRNPIPFEVEFPRNGMFESYLGMFIDVRYTASVELKRGKLHRNITHIANFSAINPGQAYDPTNVHGVPIDFHLTPSAASKGAAHFELRGRIDASRLDCTSPLTGHIEIIATHSPIRAIKLQLIRVEEVVSGAKTAREASEIQSVYVAQGDVLRAMSVTAKAAGGKADPKGGTALLKQSPTTLPLFMIFPRNYSAPTLLTTAFRVEFEVNLEVSFEDHVKVTQNFPVRLWRKAVPAGVPPAVGVCWVLDDAAAADDEAKGG